VTGRAAPAPAAESPLTEEQVAKAIALLRPNWAAICEAERRALRESAEPAARSTATA